MKKFKKDVEKIYLSIKEILSQRTKSKILQQYFYNEFESFLYATLINNFLNNLSQKNVIEYNLPKGQLKNIKLSFKEVRKEIIPALSLRTKNKFINKIYYGEF